jgi:UDP-glucose 4-epimerase
VGVLPGGVNNFIFSSTAAVFEEPQYFPIDERHPINPYGKSKFMVELMLADMEKAYDFRSVSLRYFNAAGADPNGDIGERHYPETHLIPLALRAALEENKEVLQVFGGDYGTPDGTCIVDYIHVVDLCAAHVLALQYLWGDGKSDAFNLGNGTGFSIYQVLDSVKAITGVAVCYRLSSRRPGDPERLVADSTKAAKILGWRPQYPELNTIVKHAWLWEQKRINKLVTNGEVKN